MTLSLIRQADVESDTGGEKKKDMPHITYSRILKGGRVIFALLSVCFCGLHCYFFDPFLADYLLSQFHLKDSLIGFAFSAYGLGFVVSAAVGSTALILLSRKSTMILGSVLCGVATMLIGPSQLLGLDPHIAFTYIGLLLSGTFSGMMFAPAYPEALINNSRSVPLGRQVQTSSQRRFQTRANQCK